MGSETIVEESVVNPKTETQPPQEISVALESPTEESYEANTKEVAEDPKDDPLEQHYLGTHKLGVNRVTDGRRIGAAIISKSEDGKLHLNGSVRKGLYRFNISGIVEPVSLRKFHLRGEFSGVPDMSWNDESPRARRTTGRFTFEATKGRRYWRMYQVNDRNCVCYDNCGNDFCYVDIEFLEID